MTWSIYSLSPIHIFTDLTNRQNIRANAALNWEIIKGLKARTEFAIGHGWSEGKYLSLIHI